MKFHLALAAGLLAAAPVFADSHGGGEMSEAGDVAKGEKTFKRCVACHSVINDAGETLAGRGAKTGPNLYGVAGRAAGSEEGFRYSKALQTAGEAGLVWTAENFAEFVQDPSGFLSEELGDSGARSAMSFKVRKEEEAQDLYAYLASLAQ
ncbi:c-type cytochrome [Actibacterium sp. MT2.3-13A]|uniref:c-type cytochrome n=1 Tax=Actibacterium sp. MT2.3-13A TaxID=2828332 RepID=UPI001BADF595|nr:c-type cytochrome [Actibacterium sp. MT2.3-13A]